MAQSLREKAMLCEEIMEARHNYEGQVRRQVILPPVGLPDCSTGNHESDALWSGDYLAIESFRWAATGDPAAKRRAKQGARALRKLQRITRSKGCFARGFKRASGPTWDEQCFFFPREWHQSGEYRWVGDPSTDSLVGLMFGYEVYYDLVADAREKQEVAKDIDIIMSRIVDADMRILDVDGRMTLWGNMCPPILDQDLKALNALSHLRGAYHITKKRRYLDEYHRLIEQWDYHKKAAKANAQADPVPSPWDWNLALEPLYTLLQYEKDERLLRYYYAALEMQWRRIPEFAGVDPYYNWVYKAFKPRAPMLRRTWQWMETFEVGLPRERGLPSPFAPSLYSGPHELHAVVDGKPRVFHATSEQAPRDFLKAYWLGRYHGFIPEDA